MATNIWPGFVDALAALLMVVIFVLLVFTVAQFYLSNMLSGSEGQVLALRQQLDDARRELAITNDTLAERNARFLQQSLELQASLDQASDLNDEVADLQRQHDAVVDRLDQALADMRILQGERDDLNGQLTGAAQRVAADRQTIEDQVREISSLQADVAALRTARDTLEVQVASLALSLRVAQTEAARLDAELDETVSLADLLRAQLSTANADNATLTQSLDDADRLLSESEAEVAELTASLTRSQGETDEAQRSLAESQEDNASLAATLADMEARAAALGESLAAIREETAELRVQRDAAAALAQYLNTDLDTTAAAAQEAQANLTLTQEEILELRDLLAAERRTSAGLAADLDEALDESAGLGVQLRLSRQERDALLQEITTLRDRSMALETRLSDEEERTALAQRTIEEHETRIDRLIADLAGRNAALEAQEALAEGRAGTIDRLTAEVEALHSDVRRLNAALAASEAQVDDRDQEIVNLEAELNQALLRQVEELTGYRSEFFGELSQVLGDRPGIEVQGDRFVFQSEVLFRSGSARLEPQGRERLAEFARTILDLAAEFPEDVDWVLRVDGHTDRRPIVDTSEFASNWELSTARATEVVRFLAEQGIPPERLAAAGFGEFQPIDDGDTEEAYARNRRIEMRLDQR